MTLIGLLGLAVAALFFDLNVGMVAVTGGEEVATVGAPLLAALVICFIGGAVSAFALTTGILGALIPVAVPFLAGTVSVGAVGLITGAGSLVLGSRLQPLLDQRRAHGGERAEGAPRVRL